MSLTTPDQPPAPSLVGRDRELATLRSALEAASAGHSTLVLIGGEAGVGKTALAEAICAEATARGALALVGRCYDLSETPPYGPWRELFDRAPRDGGLPALPAAVLPSDRPGESVSSRDASARHALAYLAALGTTRALVLLLEDLHWADPASLDLLRAIARASGDLPVLLLATYRDDEVSRRHALYSLLPVLEREARAVRLDVRRLDDAGVGGLVAARYALPATEAERLTGWLLGRAQGNAFFSTQLLRVLEDDAVLRRVDDTWALGDVAAVGLPTPLRQVLDARLDRLGEASRQFLALAAVIGQEVSLTLWAAVAETDEDGLLDAVEGGVEARLLDMAPAGDTVRFAHALIREALYEGILPLRRRRLHRRVAEALIALPTPDPDAVAYQLQHGGDPRAVEWLIRAGERAQRAHAWLTAAERFEAAVVLLDGAGAAPRQRALLRITLAQLRRYDDPRWGIAALDEAARLATEADDDALAACARFDQGHMRCATLDFRRGIAQMVAALPALEALPSEDRWGLPALVVQGPSAGEHYHRGVVMVNLARCGRYEEAGRLGEEITTDGPGATARVLFGLGLVRAGLGHPDEARRAMAAARAIYRASDNHAEVAITLAYEQTVALAPYQADRLGERRRLATEAAEAWARARGAGATGGLGRTALPLLIVEGHWAEARDLALAWGGYDGNNLAAWALGYLGRAQGDPEPALRAIDRWFPDGPASEPGEAEWPMALYLQRLAVGVALDAGDLPAARAWLAAHDRWLAQSDAVIDRAEGQLAWADYHRTAGDHTAAGQHTRRAIALANEPLQPLALAHAHCAFAEQEIGGGHLAAARTHLGAAVTLAEACAAPYERALCLLALAALHLAGDDRTGARAALQEARALLAPLGARPALVRAGVLAQRLAAPAPAESAGDILPFGLTPRELEALQLVAQGLSDRQIAARLFVTRNTVSTHLKAVYGKLGVTSRAAATRLALEQDLA